MIYLDSAATTPVAPEVMQEMESFFTEQYGNAGSIHKLGRDAAAAISKAREQVSSLIGADPEQIIFTSGGSEANSLVFQGIKEHLLKIGKKTIIVSAVEHNSVLKAAKALCETNGFVLKYVGVDKYGRVPANVLASMITPDVGFVSVMYVNNETGMVNPVQQIGRICKENNILFHTDCVQAAGCNPINVDEINCDFLSISAHKMHAPKGVGALFARDKSILTPIIYGGAEQEFGLRGGTENTAGIVGFGKACELALAKDSKYNQVKQLEWVNQLKRDFIKEMRRSCRDLFRVNGCIINNSGKAMSIRFNGVDAQSLVLALESRGICVSAGSACESHESKPSHVLLAMGLTEEQARNSIRISFSAVNEKIDAYSAASSMSLCVKKLAQG